MKNSVLYTSQLPSDGSGIFDRPRPGGGASEASPPLAGGKRGLDVELELPPVLTSVTLLPLPSSSWSPSSLY